MDRNDKNTRYERMVRFLAENQYQNDAVSLSQTEHERWTDEEDFKNHVNTWKILNEMQEMEQFDTDKAWNKLFGRLTDEELLEPQTRLHGAGRFNWSYVVAASLLVLMGITGLFFYQKWDRITTYANNELEAKIVFLPDGTEVSLNTDANLKYSRAFGTENREVSLEGEAFFNVKRNELLPFIIHSNETNVEVLGTSFNVNASGEQVEVVVKTGQVAVYKQNNKENQVLLIPGESAISGSIGIVKSPNSQPNYRAWLDKKLVFKAMPLSQVINDINHAYHAQITIGDSSLQSLLITTTYQNNTIDEVLESIAVAFNLKVEKQEKSYILVSK